MHRNTKNRGLRGAFCKILMAQIQVITMVEILLVIFCILTISSAFTTCMSSKIIRSAFFFGSTLFLIAFIFILIGSPLLGTVQILLYTGGTLILFLFAIILTRNWDYEDLGETFHRPIRALSVSFLFFISMSFFLFESEIFIELEKNFTIGPSSSIENISFSLFNDWFLILELSSILLLATIVGCLVLLKFREEID